MFLSIGTTTALTALFVSRPELNSCIKSNKASMFSSSVNEKNIRDSLLNFSPGNQLEVINNDDPFLYPSISELLRLWIFAFLKSDKTSFLNSSTAVTMTNFISVFLKIFNCVGTG